MEYSKTEGSPCKRRGDLLFYCYRLYRTDPDIHNDKTRLMGLMIFKKRHIYCILLLFLLGSCSAIDEKWDDCPRRFGVKVKYDYNMLGADAFAAQIRSIRFFIFDRFDRLVREEVREAPFREDVFRFDLPEGKYRFACVASDEKWETVSRHWEVPHSAATLHRLEEMTVRMKGIEDNSLSSLLPGLWYASPKSPTNTDRMLHVEEYGEDEVVMSLIRNTADIRLILQKGGEEQLQAERFYCAVEGADNRATDHADNVISGERFKYLPYIQKTITAQEEGTGKLEVVAAEWTVNRLTVNDKSHLVIRDKETGMTIFDRELVPLLLMLRHEKFAQMPAQEFLDREYEYEFYLMLDEYDRWAQLLIKVRDWTVRINRMDLE